MVPQECLVLDYCVHEFRDVGTLTITSRVGWGWGGVGGSEIRCDEVE